MAEFYTSDECRLFYRQAGSGPVALFLSAMLIDGALWLDQLAGLRDIRRCIALDFRGHGLSDPTARAQMTKADYAADVVEFVAALEGQVDLVGFSGGGEVAAMVHEALPGKVRSIALLSSNFNAEDDPLHRRYRQEFARLAVMEDRVLLFRRYLEYIVDKDAGLHVKARYRSMMERTPYETIYTFLTHTFGTDPRPDLPAKLDVPVLAPVSVSDPVVRLTGPLAQLPQGRMVKLPAGRLAPMEAPEALNDALRAFWSEVGGA